MGALKSKRMKREVQFLLYMFFYCKRYHPGILARFDQPESGIIGTATKRSII